MNFLISGGTGFVGTHLATSLHKQEHHTYILTRNPENYRDTPDTTYIDYDFPVQELPSIHGVINLAGESLFGYWTKKKKKLIVDSRVNTTNIIYNIIKKLSNRPEVFINGSSIGYYGMSEDMIFTEASTEPGRDYLAKIVTTWEKTAAQVEQLGIRTVYTRFGIILGDKGALPIMALPVKLFAGGKIGSGEQWMSWVHITDAVDILLFCIANNNIKGPVNVTAPNPKRNIEFMKTLANVLNRPFWLNTPSSLFRAVAGEMSLLVLKGQYVLPRKISDYHYEFSHPYLEEALRNIYQNT